MKPDNMSLKQTIKFFNNQERCEFENLYTERYELLKQKKWIRINGVWALHGKYSPEKQIYALRKCEEIGVRATSRLLGVSRRTLQRWCRRFNVSIPRYPPWMEDWRERKIRKRDFWRLRGF